MCEQQLDLQSISNTETKPNTRESCFLFLVSSTTNTARE